MSLVVMNHYHGGVLGTQQASLKLYKPTVIRTKQQSLMEQTVCRHICPLGAGTDRASEECLTETGVTE